MNSLLSTALTALYKFWYYVWSFGSKYLKICLGISFLTHELFRNMLFHVKELGISQISSCCWFLIDFYLVREHILCDFNLFQFIETCFYSLAYCLSWWIFFVHLKIMYNPAVVGWKCESLSHVWLFATPWAIQSLEFSRPEYWSG